VIAIAQVGDIVASLRLVDDLVGEMSSSIHPHTRKTCFTWIAMRCC
jgi:hypothetical protein